MLVSFPLIFVMGRPWGTSVSERVIQTLADDINTAVMNADMKKIGWEAIVKTLFISALFAISSGANADLFKCKDATGKVEWKSKPCIITTTTLISIQGNRVKQFDEGEIPAAVKQLEVSTDAPPSDVQPLSRRNLEIAKYRCVPVGCSPVEWRNALYGVSTSGVVWLLGRPRIQLVGISETHYYAVKLDQVSGTF